MTLVASLVLLCLTALAGPAGPAATRPAWELDLGAAAGNTPSRLWACGPLVLVEDAGHGVTAVATSTGELLWVVRLAGPLTDAPAAGGGAITLSAGRELLVVDALGGRRRLQVTLAAPAGAAPVADRALAYVPSAAGNRLLALDDRGQRAWGYRDASPFVGAARLVGGGRQATVVVPTLDGRLLGLPAGHDLPAAARWELRTGLLLDDPLPAGDDLLVATVGGAVARIDADSGSVRWRRLLGEPAVGGVALADTLVLVGTATRLVALASDDGSPRWELPAAGRPLGATGGVLACRAEDGALHLHRARDGAPLPPLRSRPRDAVVSDDHLVVLVGAVVRAWHGSELGR